MASTWEDWVQTYPWILAREEKHGGKRNTQCIGVRTRHCTCFSFSFYVHLTKISKKGSGDFAAAVGFYSCPSGSSVILNHLPKRATCAVYTLAQRIILLAPGKWTSVSVKHWKGHLLNITWRAYTADHTACFWNQNGCLDTAIARSKVSDVLQGFLAFL